MKYDQETPYNAELLRSLCGEDVIYHCTKRVHPNCSQGSISLDDLETEITNKLGKFEIDEGFRDWAINYLNELNAMKKRAKQPLKVIY